MSSFASHHQDVIPNPFEDGITFTISKLSGAAFERAQAEHLRKLIAGHSPRGWERMFQQRVADGTATNEDALRVITDPLAGLDRLSIVKSGLKGWSYVEADSTPKKLTDGAIEDLDDETLEHLAMEIMRRTKPTRFMTAEELKEARKNV